ncbi:17360_t:CDS:1, partial [Gigaspora margarita]
MKFINDGFRIQNRKVLFLVDNAPSYILSKKDNINNTEEPKGPEVSEEPEISKEQEEPEEPEKSEEPEKLFQETPQKRSQGRFQG